MTVELSRFDLDWFERGKQENPTFWWRIGGMPALAGRSVLDVGCGLGSLCVDMARAGARRVLGIDIDDRLVEFARENVRQNHPELAATLELRAVELAEMGGETFDVVTSKDAFEHILELPRMLSAIREHLVPGGRLYAGWGPLYHSPFGDHGRTRALVPWGHVIVPERLLLARLGAGSVEELGLNKLAPADYRRMFRASGLDIVSMRLNRSKNPFSRVFSVLMRLPGLERFFAHNAYCVLERPARDG